MLMIDEHRNRRQTPGVASHPCAPVITGLRGSCLPTAFAGGLKHSTGNSGKHAW